MKKTELKNCPQWLLNASTKNEDVNLDRYGTLIWSGGEFLGGYFRGGEFLGGYFRGGEFLGGYFLGEKISKAPLFIFNIGKWSAAITQTKMAIGCKNYLHAEWESFTDKEIQRMDTDALEFWQKNKSMLLALCEFNSH